MAAWSDACSSGRASRGRSPTGGRVLREPHTPLRYTLPSTTKGGPQRVRQQDVVEPVPDAAGVECARVVSATLVSCCPPAGPSPVASAPRKAGGAAGRRAACRLRRVYRTPSTTRNRARRSSAVGSPSLGGRPNASRSRAIRARVSFVVLGDEPVELRARAHRRAGQSNRPPRSPGIPRRPAPRRCGPRSARASRAGGQARGRRRR